jgi:hypothetical protein
LPYDFLPRTPSRGLPFGTGRPGMVSLITELTPVDTQPPALDFTMTG